MKKVLCALLIFVLLSSLCACGEIIDAVLDNETEAPEIIEVKIDEYKMDCYDQLNSSGKEIYRAVLYNVMKNELSFSVNGVDVDSYMENAVIAVSAVICDHPEFFWLNGNMKCSGSGSKVTVTLEKWDYFFSAKEGFDSLKCKFDSKVNEIAEAAGKLTSDYEKALFVHDYIIEHADYDHEGVEPDTPEHSLAHTAYGCLLNGKAVCSGYSKAFQCILNKLGIKCRYIAGDSTKGTGHAWNYAILDGDGCCIDVTWDDATMYGLDTKNSPVYHTYFGLTYDEISRTHLSSSEFRFEYPRCNGTKNNYYVKNGFCASDLKEAVSVMEKQSKNDIITVRFNDKKTYDKAISGLTNTDGWYESDALPNRFSYAVYDDVYVITFFPK